MLGVVFPTALRVGVVAKPIILYILPLVSVIVVLQSVVFPTVSDIFCQHH